MVETLENTHANFCIALGGGLGNEVPAFIFKVML